MALSMKSRNQKIKDQFAQVQSNPRPWLTRFEEQSDSDFFWVFPRFKESIFSAAQGEMQGPTGSPYEGGVFAFEVGTRIFHPNINKQGDVALPLLSSWAPNFTPARVIDALYAALSEPDTTPGPNSDGELTEARIMFDNNRPAYEAKAREWTQKFAA